MTLDALLAEIEARAEESGFLVWWADYNDGEAVGVGRAQARCVWLNESRPTIKRLVAALRLSVDYANREDVCEGWSAFDLEINISRILDGSAK